MLVVPDSPSAGELAKSGAEFCRLFPNRFFYVDDTRGLSAGFHLIEGFFRDDQPLMKSVLDDAERAELDRLWSELEFVTGITEKMLRGFVFFERSERNFLKHADFATAIRLGRGHADDRIERNLFMRACGYEYIAEKPMNIDEMPMVDRITCSHGLLVCTTARGPTV